MMKNQFMNSLNQALNKLPTEERQDILRDYEEHFLFGQENGKNEEEIVRSLGSPTQIAKEILAEYHIEKTETTSSTVNLFRAAWAVISLGFFNLVFVLGPLVGLIGVVVSGWAVGIALIATPFASVFERLFFPEEWALFEFFLALAFAGIGIFVLIGMFYASKVLTALFVRYLKFNMSIVTGKNTPQKIS